GIALFRGDVLVFNRREKQLFIADKMLYRRPFSFMISKKRRDLVEPLNRAVALTSTIYPRTMTRYIAPYGVYSKKIDNIEALPLKLSNLDSVWFFFAICAAAIFIEFIVELIV
ncbi:hypothetical protein PENTCL1PPCAC_18603, partial [Pristionchus entomophagus]